MDTHLQENSGVTDVAATYFKSNLVRISATKECGGGGGIIQPFLTGGTSCKRAVGLTLQQVFPLENTTASAE